MMDNILFFDKLPVPTLLLKVPYFSPFLFDGKMILKSDGSQVRATHIHDAMIDYPLVI